ncbi:MAG: MurR/RpiR family transcriptional regulator, partial [Spirochaetota bacterium]
GISNSGRTVQTVNSMKQAKDHGATTICITNYTHSPIVEYSDIKLFTATKVIPFIQESMESRIAQMLIIDILYARYAAKNFENSIDLINESAKSLKNALYRKH